METVKRQQDTLSTHNLVVGYMYSVKWDGRQDLVMNVKPNWTKLDSTGEKKKGFLELIDGGNGFNSLLTIDMLMETVKFHDTTVSTLNLVVGYIYSEKWDRRQDLVMNVKPNWTRLDSSGGQNKASTMKRKTRRPLIYKKKKRKWMNWAEKQLPYLV